MTTTIVTELPDEATSESHQVAALVEVLQFGEVVAEIDAIEAGSVTLDASASIRGGLDLAIPGTDFIPVDPSALLAPFGNELRVSIGIAHLGDEQLIRAGVYRIERATLESSSDGETTRITGLDRASWIEDVSFLETYNIPSGTQATDAIADIVTAVLPLVEMDFIEVDVELPALVAEIGDSRWEMARGIATSIQCELYFDDDGILVLRPIPGTGQGIAPIATVAEGEGGVLLSADRDWDRADVYNHITVTGESATDDTPVVSGVAIDDNPDSPTYAYGPFGFKPFRYSTSFVKTDDDAASVAAGILARFLGAPDVINFAAVPNPALRPSDVIRVTREVLGIDEDHILDQVTIPLTSGETMSAQTRAAQELSG